MAAPKRVLILIVIFPIVAADLIPAIIAIARVDEVKGIDAGAELATAEAEAAVCLQAGRAEIDGAFIVRIISGRKDVAMLTTFLTHTWCGDMNKGRPLL